MDQTKDYAEYLRYNGKVMLAFASKTDRKRDTEALGRLIVKTLKDCDLLVDWNGKSDERIEVVGIT